jgi:LysM repeat protein
MKNLTLQRLKSLAPQPKKKVRKLAANAAHRLTPPAFEDYDEEPTTKLSTAFVVVLILHLVAVGGIYAFHSIKTHRRQAEGTPNTESVTAKKAAGVVAPTGSVPVQNTPAIPASKPTGTPVVGKTSPTAPVPGTPQAQPLKPAMTIKEPTGTSAVISQSKPAPAAPQVPFTPAPGGTHSESSVPPKPYVVVKGDNPTTIAKRLGVSESELLKMNGIDDPKKLQIGQVLKVPAKKAAN